MPEQQETLNKPVEQVLLAEVLSEDISKLAKLIWTKLSAFKEAKLKFKVESKTLEELSKNMIPNLSIFSKNILTSGLSIGKIEVLVASESEEELNHRLQEFIEQESVEIRHFFETTDTGEHIRLASERLEDLFVKNGSEKRDSDVPVSHTGATARFVMNAKQNDFAFMPMHVGEHGQHFAEYGMTYVYHDESSTPASITSTSIHEKTHAYGHNKISDNDRGQKMENGFASVEKENGKGWTKNEEGREFNEGFTEYLARKSCDGIVDYKTLPEGGVYQDELALIKHLIANLVEKQSRAIEEVESDLLKIYQKLGDLTLNEYLSQNNINLELLA